MILSAIRKLTLRENLTREEAEATLSSVMEGEATPAQIAAFAVALRMKGETVEEAAGFVQAMRSRMAQVSPKRRPLLDTCGTGGGKLPVFNVSTTAAFAAASAGIGIAKHGNRAMSGICGSADVLEALGVKLTLAPTQIAQCIDEIGIGFLFAPVHHSAMRHVANVRKEIGIRTVFNLLGPLTNPADAELRVMGVYDPEMMLLATGALRKIGVSRAMVLYAEAGLVEISTFGSTLISELREGEIESYALTPSMLGVSGEQPELASIAPSPDPLENARMVRETLAGQDDTPAKRARRDLVAVNLAASLRVAGKTDSWTKATLIAQEILSSGAGVEVLENLIEFTSKASLPQERK